MECFPTNIPSSDYFDPQKFCMICRIGDGGLGKVKLYHNTATNHLRAIKFSNDPILVGKSLSDFIREVQTLYKNQHPTIVRVYSYGIPKSPSYGNPWMELEYIPCGTLSDFIDIAYSEADTTPEIEVTYLMKILFGTAYGIAYLHARNVIHRDIKPQNIMLDCNFEPKIGDFGFARELKPIDNVSSYPYTLHYAAPELLEAMKHFTNYTNKVDVYSFGMTLYECRMFEIPFANVDNKMMIMRKITSHDIPSLPSNDPFYEIYRKCTSTNPEQRPTMIEVTQMLNDIAYQLYGVDILSFEEYRNRIASYKEGDSFPDSGSPENLINAASLGLPQAQFHLGMCYFHGEMFEKDLEKAAKFLKYASNQNHTDAMKAYLEMVDDEYIEIDDEEYEDISLRLSQCQQNTNI